MAESTNASGSDFQKKVWIAASIVALFVVLIWILKAVFNVLLLILAGSLIALYFHGLSGLINRKAHIPRKGSLAISVLGSLILLSLFFWLAGDRIAQQAQQLSETLPSAIEKFKAWLNTSTIGQQISNKLSEGGGWDKTAAVIKTFFSTTFGLLGDIYVVLFLGIFLTVSPGIYIDGFLKLIPAKAKPRAKEVVGKVGITLTKWLKGKILSMIAVFVLTAIGLAILGMPMWLVLALIAGLLSFIPNFGPLLAAVPAVLVGLMVSPTKGLLVAGLYITVQLIESNLITTQIQKKLINIPPALIITAQLFMGVLTGGWGLVLATPLAAMVMVMLQELYINSGVQEKIKSHQKL